MVWLSETASEECFLQASSTPANSSRVESKTGQQKPSWTKSRFKNRGEGAK